jgi:hypothetical protein
MVIFTLPPYLRKQFGPWIFADEFFLVAGLFKFDLFTDQVLFEMPVIK